MYWCSYKRMDFEFKYSFSFLKSLLYTFDNTTFCIVGHTIFLALCLLRLTELQRFKNDMMEHLENPESKHCLQWQFSNPFLWYKTDINIPFVIFTYGVYVSQLIQVPLSSFFWKEQCRCHLSKKKKTPKNWIIGINPLKTISGM